MKASPLPSRSRLAPTPAAAAAAAPAHDALSTSSSTLVNADMDEDKARRRLRLANTPSLHALDEEGPVPFDMKRGLFTSDGWLRADARPASSAKREYADDHRCSDQETASGLCRCAQDASPDSASPSSPGGERAEPGRRGARESDDERANYDQQLLAARKRKLLAEMATTRARDYGMSTMEGESGDSTSHSLRRSRDLRSDPVLVPRPSLSLRHPSSSSDDDEWSRPILNRRWASSPTLPGTKSRSLGEQDAFISGRRSSTPRVQSASSERTKDRRSSSAASQTSMPLATPPSAARRSISNVFEKLLKEEESRREEERVRKEAARERRREEKRRREEEKGAWEHSNDFRETQAPMLWEKSEADGVDLGSDALPEEASRTQQDASRLERLSQTVAHGSSAAKIPPRVSPSKPTADFYRRRLDALGSMEEEGKGEGSTAAAAPALHVEGAAEETHADPITRFSFPSKPSPTLAGQEVRRFLSPDPNSTSPHSSQGQLGSPSSPRRNAHRRTGNREGVVDVISLSANSPSLHQEQVQSRVESLFESPVMQAANEEGEETANVDDKQISSQSLRRVTFSPQPEVIESVIEEEEEEGEEGGEEEEETEKGKREESDEAGERKGGKNDWDAGTAVAEDRQIDLDVIDQATEDATGDGMDDKVPSATPARRLSGTPLRRTYASPMFPGAYLSPALPLSSPSVSYSRHVLRPRQAGPVHGLKESPLLRSTSPPLRARPLALQQTGGPPRSRSSSSNLSMSDHSFSRELEALVEDEDHVTTGSDFQGQAPLQSTPPRASLSRGSNSIAEPKTEASLLGDDSLRLTLRQLAAVLRNVGEINEDTCVQVSAVQAPASLSGKPEREQETLQPLLAGSDCILQGETQSDDFLEDRLGAIRKRLQRLAKTRAPEKRRGRSTSLLWMLVIQLGLACLLVMAAEARAKQLFLTTYHDPFRPHGMLEVPATTAASLLAPLLQPLSLFPLGEHFWEDNKVQLGWSWGHTITWALHQTLHGGERAKVCKLLAAKTATLLDLDGIDVFRVGNFVPT